MSEYTPTTEGVRETYAQSLYWRGRTSPERAQQFDRWLAAHDAESWRSERQVQEMFGALAFIMLDADIGERARAIADQFTSSEEVLRLRAGVVAEEPEWEYGYELIESDTRDVLTRSGAFESEEAAQHWARKAHADESDPEYPPLDVLIVRRRKAGPWIPVES